MARRVQTDHVADLPALAEDRRWLYEAVLATTPDFVYVFSLDHKVLYANESLIKMWGRGRDGAIGKTFREIGYEPWHAQRHEREIDQVRATRQPIRGHVPFHGTNGLRQYEYIFVPVIGNNGEVEAVAGTTRDVTEQKDAERKLREGQEQLDFALAAADLGQWSLNLADRQAHRTLRHDQIFGYDALLPEWTYGMFLEHVVPDDRAAVDAGFQEALATGSAWDVECRIRRADGDIRNIWTKALIQRDAGGNVERMLGIVGDVTERRRAEATLKESEQRFRLVADAAPVLIWVSGTDKLCQWFNQPWLAFTGRSLAQEVGNGWTEGIHPDDFDSCLQTYRDAFDARTPFSMEYRLRRHDGEHRWLIDNGVPRFRPGGEFDGYIGSCLDVTDYKNAEAGLQDADRRKDEFLATLAHELRNPLAPISNGLQVMRMAEAQGTIEQARSMMERQMVQITRLVDDLLDVSRVKTGKLELRRERLDLRDVVAAALETSLPLIEQQAHHLAVAVPHEPVLVDGDPIRLAQVVSNLLTNAAKYTHRGGHIRLSVASKDATAVLAVSDNGIGIPKDMLDTVFGMFTQVDRTLEKTTGGLGIGLSLVKGLVEMHGGTVGVRSDGEGRGSEFTVRLPVCASLQTTSQPRAGEAIKVEPTAPRRILIVDDNVDATDSLEQLLEMMGNEVRTAYDGETGVEVARAFCPGLVLCDIGMPKMNGYDTARRIRAEAWGKDAVLVALTGRSQEEDHQRSVEAGFDHHLVKPVDAGALMKLLARPVGGDGP